MKRFVLAATFLAGGLMGLQDVSFAHGGQYRGPGDTVPPGGGGGGGGGAGAGPTGPAGPSTPSPSGPSAPGPVSPGTPTTQPTQPTTGGPATPTADLTLWSFWWEFNKEPYLNLRSKVRTGATDSGSDGFFLGRGEREKAKDSLAPSQEQIRQTIVPALKRALEGETNNDIVTGAMIALAKIGDVRSEDGSSEFVDIISGFLNDSNQEISETAAVSLGILENPASIQTLVHLLADDAEGRKLINSNEVPYRTRAFAAYGLGLIGAADSATAEHKAEIVGKLVELIAADTTSTRDLKVACIISLGLVPIENMTAPMAEDAEGPQPANASREAQLQYLYDFLNDEDNNFLVRAHCPTALARLLDGTTEEVHGPWKAKLSENFVSILEGKDKNEVVESATIALGLLATNGEADKDLREALTKVIKDVSDQQARNFSMVAVAKSGANPGENSEDGIAEAGKFLMGQLESGKSAVQPWAGLSIGVMCNKLDETNQTHAIVPDMARALRSALADEKSPSNLGAYAVGTGIMKDIEAAETLRTLLDEVKDVEARGYVAVALGLMEDQAAKDQISEIIDESKYRPDLLKQAAIALGLLGDKELVDTLITMLQNANGLATQAALSSALGFIGDSRSVNPLVDMLENEDLTDLARGFAAVALGIVADDNEMPWNSKIAEDLNYRASTSTLVDPGGTGILDIL